jgi:hypothetical protein
MKTYNPTCVVGDTIEIPIKWVDSADEPISFLQRRVDFVVRRDQDDLSALYSADSTNNETEVDRLEVTKSDSSYKGELVITIPSASTLSFPVGTLPYQLQVTDINGFVRTILRGTINMLADVAR